VAALPVIGNAVTVFKMKFLIISKKMIIFAPVFKKNDMITIDQLKDLLEREDALRRYL